jgi:uncharacterized protein
MKPFLTAQWRHLAMFNWEVNPDVLRARIPAGTELDSHGGRTFLSLVGFCFLDARLRNLRVPFHVNFPEVNLRFYVKRIVGNETHRGVVFIQEIVPRACVAMVARRWYHENFVTARMSHEVCASGSYTRVKYAWMLRGKSYAMGLSTVGEYQQPAPGSDQEFITEHYWGYSRQPDGRTVEYQVAHPPWRVAGGTAPCLEGDFASLYGKEFGRPLQAPPTSMFLADGSSVAVGPGTRL